MKIEFNVDKDSYEILDEIKMILKCDTWEQMLSKVIRLILQPDFLEDPNDFKDTLELLHKFAEKVMETE